MTTATSLTSVLSTIPIQTEKAAVASPRHGTQVEFGDLTLAFTTQYEHRWSDRGSGASRDGQFFHPIPPAGFFALGSIGVSDHDDANGRFASMCVKPAGNPSKPPLMPPVRWDFIWNDRSSGANEDGSCWRPVPPDGYVALGDVFVNGHDAPQGMQVMCVARELTIDGTIGGEIYDDSGSGAKMDFGAWQIDASTAFIDTPDGIFAVNSFVGAQTHDKPQSSVVAHNLRLPLPTLEAGGPQKPQLTGRIRPPARTNPVVDRVVVVPFTAILDRDTTLQWKVDNSPFYEIERAVDYRLVNFIDNSSDVSQSASTAITTGISEMASTTFSVTTGLTFGYESGAEAGGFSTKVSISLKIEFGYSSTSSVTQFREETDQATLIAASKHAAAIWTESQSYRVFRSDNTPTAEPLVFDTSDTAYVISDFNFGPPSEGNEPRRPGALVSRTRRRL